MKEYQQPIDYPCLPENYFGVLLFADNYNNKYVFGTPLLTYEFWLGRIIASIFLVSYLDPNTLDLKEKHIEWNDFCFGNIESFGLYYRGWQGSYGLRCNVCRKAIDYSKPWIEEEKRWAQVGKEVWNQPSGSTLRFKHTEMRWIEEKRDYEIKRI